MWVGTLNIDDFDKSADRIVSLFIYSVTQVLSVYHGPDIFGTTYGLWYQFLYECSNYIMSFQLFHFPRSFLLRAKEKIHLQYKDNVVILIKIGLAGSD